MSRGFLLLFPWFGLVASRDELHQCIKQKIGTKKCLVSILWSINGIHGLLDAPKGTTYNTAFFTDAVMPNMIENIWSQTRRKCRKVDWFTWTMHIFTIRGQLKGVSRPQEPNAERVRIAAQIWPRVTSSSLDISKETIWLQL
jgi:hypothetical protein